MPRLQKTARRGRSPDARRNVSPVRDSVTPDPGPIVGVGSITAGELAAASPDKLPPELAADFPAELDRGTRGSVEEQAHAAADAAAGSAPAGADGATAPDLGIEGAPAPALTPEQLLSLCETGKALLVTLLGKAWSIPDDRLAELSKLDPSTRATLRVFAPDALKYLPAFTSNAPAIGAACFAGFLALDLYQTQLRLRAARTLAPELEARTVAPRDAHGSRIVGAENLPGL